MPPFTYPSFEAIEAKEWASNTMSTILTDVSPLSFETNFSHYSHPFMLEIKTTIPKDVSQFQGKSSSNLRRSFSFFEGFSPQRQQVKAARNSRRSQSTILPSTTTTDCAGVTQSAPITPTNQTKPSPPPSFSSLIRHTWHLDYASFGQLFFKTSHHKKSTKELKGIAIWNSKKAEYTVKPPRSLEFKIKPFTKRLAQHSKFIMAELLTTEETYLNHLMTVKNFYMDPLMDAAISGNKRSSLVDKKDIEIIFAFIPQLILLSSELVERLHETIGPCLEDVSKKNQVSIGKAFCDLESYFDVYISYSINFAKSRKYLEKTNSNIVYCQLVQDSMRRKETNRMVLSDYMIAPIQRITRYCLLLTDLQKHSNRSHPDYVYLQRTLTSLSALAFAMNTVQ